MRPGVEVEISREPVGVVGIITPWNFPIAIPAWKIAPALAYGNSVVFKPADLTPAGGWALAEIISRSGLPPGVCYRRLKRRRNFLVRNRFFAGLDPAISTMHLTLCTWSWLA